MLISTIRGRGCSPCNAIVRMSKVASAASTPKAPPQTPTRSTWVRPSAKMVSGAADWGHRRSLRQALPKWTEVEYKMTPVMHLEILRAYSRLRLTRALLRNRTRLWCVRRASYHSTKAPEPPRSCPSAATVSVRSASRQLLTGSTSCRRAAVAAQTVSGIIVTLFIVTGKVRGVGFDLNWRGLGDSQFRIR